MKKHPGRPKVGTQTAKGVMVAVRVSPPEARQLDQAIREAKQKRSEWLRQALLAAAIKKLHNGKNGCEEPRTPKPRL